ncbi:MAG: hypothetical protein ACYDBB_20575 [Armatimonadota bacterium]
MRVSMFRLCASTLLLLCAAMLFAAPPLPPGVVQQFTVTESFGVTHPDQIIDFDLDKPVDPTNSYLVGPDGQEVPYQLLEGGRKLAVRTTLPASRMAVRRGLGNTCEGWAANYKFDKTGVEGFLSTDGTFFTPGDVVRIDGATLPEGLERDTDYYVTKLVFREVTGWGFYFIGLARTPGGQPLTFTKPGTNISMISQALVADPATDQLYIHAHGQSNGAPVQFRSFGELPQPLNANVVYYVCESTPDRFKVSLTRGGKPIDLLTTGNGIHEMLNSWSWSLRSGRAPQPYAEAVKVQEKKADGVWEITNGRLGIRLPVSGVPANPTKALAPVQGVLLSNGAWTSTGGNTIAFTPGTQVKSITVKLIEQGPLKVVAELTYELDRAQFSYGAQQVCPAGPGKYVSRIEVQAGQPSVLFEEDTDCQFAYNFDFPGLTLNQARYRGHSVRDAKNGYRPDGKPVTDRQTDVFFDLPFDADYQSTYITSLKDHCIRWMQPWDPWMFDSGSYWMLFNKDGDATSPLIGFFDGRASRLRNAGAVGVGVHTRAAANGGPLAGITVQAWQRGPSAALYPQPRWQWRLFLGSKGTDMRDWRELQPINMQMNLHSGINLNKIQRLQFEFPDPPGGWGAMYMKADATKAMIEKIRKDPEFYRFAYNSVTYYRDLIDMWRDDKGPLVHAMAYNIWLGAHDGLQTLVNGQGIFGGGGFGYWHAGLAASRALMRTDQVLASELATPIDKTAVRQATVFYASVLWDDDHAPLSVPSGVNLGTANMPVQQQGYRDMYALFLEKHPMMKEYAADIRERASASTRSMLRNTINEFGAHMGCTHYIGAAMGPVLSSAQQLKQGGVVDLFKEEPRMKKYAEFEMNFCTPPDPRFNNRRARPAIGDSCPGEATEFLGQLATAYADIDLQLSARLMGAWKQSGKPESDFHGATILKIDESLPDTDPKLTSAHVEGWYSVLRFGWGTPNETAAWFVNGGFYSDHASNDLGEPIIYALGAPLSLDFGTMYSPHSPGGFVHSVVLPESAIGGDWKQSPPDVTKGPRWGKAKTEEYKVEDKQAWSKASFALGNLNWTRTMKVAMLRDDLPAIGIRDEFAGGEAEASKVFLLNLMNSGAVETPDGPKNVGDSFAIPAGVTKLHFIGQTFAKHISQGIDWDLYVIADAPQEAFLAQYEHKNVMPERQTILRLKGTGRFQVVIVPYFKGAKPEGVTVTRQGNAVRVTQGTNQATF